MEVLISVGYSVHSCEDGNTALLWYHTNHATCDLVILDYSMPVINGKECFLAMQKIHPSIKAIITSGYAVDGEIKKALNAGVCSFLQKPFGLDGLLKKVQEVLSDLTFTHT